MNRVDHTSPPKPPTRAPQRVVGRHQLFERLGSGGMGDVYRAWDSRLQRWVAIKHLTTRSDSTIKRYEHLLHEARAASALNHPAIVKIFDVFDEAGEAFLVQELVEGDLLRQRLGAPVDLEFFYAFAGECAGALAVASAQGIAHCDLKPDNIVVTEEGHARILDFGIARHYAAPPLPDPDDPMAQLQRENQDIQGTPAYLSPEVIRGLSPDSRTDIFSLGVIFYEMLTGRHPFRRATFAATLTALQHETPPAPSKSNPLIPRALDRLVLQMLAKDRNERLADADMLLIDLCRAREEAPRSEGRRRRPWILGFGATLLAGLLGLWWYTESHSPEWATPPTPYFAVQPFMNLSPDPQDEYYARGIMDVIQARLATLNGIVVIGPEAEVGAHILLEGTLQRAQDQLRITYRLVERQTGRVLSGASVEGPGEDIFTLQDELTRRVAHALANEFGLGALPETQARPTPDVTAYDFYLQARGYLRAPRRPETLEIAIRQFRQALELDPDFALAMAGLGETYWKLYTESRDPVWAQRAEEAVLRARELNPDLAGVHISLGTIYRGTGQSDNAAREFRRAMELDPGSGEAYRGLAWSLVDAGDPEGAEAAFIDAIRTQPTGWAGYSHLGSFYFRQGRFAEALGSFRKVVELTPDNADGYRNMAVMYQSLGRMDAAIAAYEHSLELKPDYRTYSNLATLYRSQGEYEKAAWAYETAINLNDKNCFVWGSLAATYKLIPARAALADSVYRCAIARGEAQLAINPNDALILAVLGQFHAMIEEVATARTMVDRALRIAPDQPDILFYASGTYEFIGDRSRALDAVQRALEAGYPADAWLQEPSLAGLVSDPEFARITRELSVDSQGKEAN